ncbi:unnamed protein product [Hapterophycus canaliculatus]
MRTYGEERSVNMSDVLGGRSNILTLVSQSLTTKVCGDKLLRSLLTSDARLPCAREKHPTGVSFCKGRLATEQRVVRWNLYGDSISIRKAGNVRSCTGPSLEKKILLNESTPALFPTQA